MAKKLEFQARSIIDLLEYNDDEKASSLLPSLTDPEQDEPITKLIERMMRGEAVGFANVSYDNFEGLTEAEAFNAVPHASRSGFDLADTTVILDEAASLAASQATPAPEPAKPSPVASPEPTPNITT